MEPKKSKKVVLILILLLLVVLIISAGAYAYIATDIFKTPEELFAKYLVNNYEQLKGYNFKPFNEVAKKMEKEASETELAMNIKDDTLGDITANLSIKSDVPNENNNVNFLIEKGGKYYFGFDIVLSKTAFGLKLEELYDKYIAIENRDLKDLASNVGLPRETVNQIPDKIEEIETFSEEDLQKIENLKTKYTQKISEGIDKTGYSVEKRVQVDVNGEDVTANKYTLKVKSKEFLTLLSNTLKELLEDPEFLELYSGETSQLKQLKSKNKELLNQIKRIDEDDELVISVYESKGKTVKTELVASNQNKLEFIINKNEIIINVLDDGDLAKVKITNTFEGNSGDLIIEISDEVNSDNNGKIIIESIKDGDNINSKILVESESLEDMQDAYECELNFRFGSSVSFDELTSGNSVVINDYAQEQFQSLLMEIMQNVYTNVAKNPDTLLGSYLGELMSGATTNLPTMEDNLDSYTSLNGDDNNLDSFSNYNDSFNPSDNEDDNTFTSSLQGNDGFEY